MPNGDDDRDRVRAQLQAVLGLLRTLDAGREVALFVEQRRPRVTDDLRERLNRRREEPPRPGNHQHANCQPRHDADHVRWKRHAVEEAAQQILGVGVNRQPSRVGGTDPG